MVIFHPDHVKSVGISESLFVRFKQVRETIENLCIKYGVPIPVIGMCERLDPCDTTAPEFIRLNVIAAGEFVWDEQYPRHVFGHYLANLEQTDQWSDHVADLIGGWTDMPTVEIVRQVVHDGPVEFECEEDDPDCGRDDCRIHSSEG